jgi:hypothetical protein
MRGASTTVYSLAIMGMVSLSGILAGGARLANGDEPAVAALATDLSKSTPAALGEDDEDYRLRLIERWQDRQSPEELQEMYGQALALPSWERPSAGSKSMTYWEQLGLGIYDPDEVHHKAGRVRCVAYAWDPEQSETTLWVGTSSGGLYRLKHLGPLNFWVPVSRTLPGSPAVGAFLHHPHNSDKILIGSGDRYRYPGSGMYRTTDGGASWTLVNLSPTPSELNAIIPDVSDGAGEVVLASGNTGVYRSANFGTTWARMYAGDVTAMVQDTLNPHIIYIGVPGQGVRRSSNWGGTFDFLGTGIQGPIGRISIALCRSYPNYLYAVVENPSTGGLSGVYRSGDYAATWTRIEPGGVDTISGGQGFHANAIAVDPDNPSRVIVGMAGVQITENATAATPCWRRNVGASCTGCCTTTADVDIGHADQTQLLFMPRDLYPGSTKILATNDGGIYRYDYVTNELASLSLTLNVAQAYGGALAFAETDPDMMIAGTQDNGTLKIEAGGSPEVTYITPGSTGADGGPVSISANNYGSFATSVGLPYNRTLSNNFGATWSDIDCSLQDLWAPVVAHHRRPGSWRIFTHDARYLWYEYVWEAPSCLWTQVNGGHPLPADFLTARFDVARTAADVFYVTEWDSPTLYVMDSSVHGNLGSMSWEDRTPHTFATPTGGWAIADRSIAKPDWVYYVTGLTRPSMAFLSTNRGLNWWNVTSASLSHLPDDANFNDLVANPGNQHQLFLATSVGVFRSDDTGIHWYRYMEGLPSVVDVSDIELIYDGMAEPLLRISTYGHGIWERVIDDPGFIFADGFETGSTYWWSSAVP